MRSHPTVAELTEGARAALAPVLGRVQWAVEALSDRADDGILVRIFDAAQTAIGTRLAEAYAALEGAFPGLDVDGYFTVLVEEAARRPADAQVPFGQPQGALLKGRIAAAFFGANAPDLAWPVEHSVYWSRTLQAVTDGQGLDGWVWSRGASQSDEAMVQSLDLSPVAGLIRGPTTSRIWRSLVARQVGSTTASRLELPEDRFDFFAHVNGGGSLILEYKTVVPSQTRSGLGIAGWSIARNSQLGPAHLETMLRACTSYALAA